MEKVNWRVSNIKPFINKYNWNGINYPSNILNLINIGSQVKCRHRIFI